MPNTLSRLTRLSGQAGSSAALSSCSSPTSTPSSTATNPIGNHFRSSQLNPSQQQQVRSSHNLNRAYRSVKSQESQNKSKSSNQLVNPVRSAHLVPDSYPPPRSTFLPYLPPSNPTFNPNPLDQSSTTTDPTLDLPPPFQTPPMPNSTNPHCAPVLQTLLQRNEGWADQTKQKQPELLDSCSKGQAPKVLWIGCSDSRVPESMVTQSQPGEVFVTRNIANQFNPNDDNAVSVLTYAVEALGVEHVVIVGHESCGGVAASLAAARAAGESQPPSPEGALQRHLSPLVKLAQSVLLDPKNKDLSDAELVQKITEASVISQMKNVAETDVLERNWKGEKSPLSGKVMEKVTVHGWIHDINTGKLRDLNVSIAPSA